MPSESEKQELPEGLLEVYLKEWELCQANLKRHNDWVWQVGSIFIALSVGAMWATTQVEIEQNAIAVWVLAFSSMVTMFLWGIIYWRARFYLHWTHERLDQIENRLTEATNLKYESCKKLLHTLIKDADRVRADRWSKAPRVRWVPPFFIVMVVAGWFVLLFHYGLLF
jgi:hypothetical protein